MRIGLPARAPRARVGATNMSNAGGATLGALTPRDKEHHPARPKC
jgi:hypothetical protein